MQQKITKAIFPVAGLGTRFLPATKTNPKEMLPIVDKPLIQYAVEEAAASGIKDLIFITNSHKRAIEDHFDANFELETKLAQSGKHDLLNIVQNVLPKNTSAVYVRQMEALGLGHAVLCAKSVINHEPFAVLLADDLVDANPPCLKQLIEVYQKTNSSVIAVQKIDRRDAYKYGMVGVEEQNGLLEVTSIVEKPDPKDAPSDLAVIGRYILSPRIFAFLTNAKQGAGGEIQLTDAIRQLLSVEKVFAVPFIGTRYDCGDKLGFLQATIQYALRHNELASNFKKVLLSIAKSI